MTTYLRYVALGDSSTEGLDDPDQLGGFLGWADRLASRVAESSPDLSYANLAVRGRLTRQVLTEQLEPALALQPDLASVFAGVVAAARTGAVVAGAGAAHEVGTDPRMWSPDRLHAGPLGHERIAAGLAEVLGLPGADGAWRTALPGRRAPNVAQRSRAEVERWREHFGPWLVRRARRQSSGDGVSAKRPQLLPVGPLETVRDQRS